MPNVPPTDLELMQTAAAAEALSALTDPKCLTLFRMLVRAGPAGIPAGVIERETGTETGEMATQLADLCGVGLVVVRQDEAITTYAANMSGTRELVGFLIEDCCGGQEQICSLIDVARSFRSPATSAVPAAR
jgi:hypothetical protein